MTTSKKITGAEFPGVSLEEKEALLSPSDLDKMDSLAEGIPAQEVPPPPEHHKRTISRLKEENVNYHNVLVEYKAHIAFQNQVIAQLRHELENYARLQKKR